MTSARASSSSRATSGSSFGSRSARNGSWAIGRRAERARALPATARADPAGSDDADGEPRDAPDRHLVLELQPAALPGGASQCGNRRSAASISSDGVVGDLVGAVVGHVADRDPGRGRGVEVDAVEADRVGDQTPTQRVIAAMSAASIRRSPRSTTSAIGSSDSFASTSVGDRRARTPASAEQLTLE